MRPQENLGSVITADGQQLVLYRRDGVYVIRVDGLELMSSRAHGSEQALAQLALEGLEGRPGRPRVLVGGLGMGYTLRAALDLLPSRAEVVVAEVFEAVADWNRGLLGALARRPLDDPRVRLEIRDVVDVLAAAEGFDAVLLDVDNGPSAFTLVSNDRLYSPHGLARLRRSLRSRGVLAVWSNARDRGFVRRLQKSGWRVRTESVPARGPGARGVRHTIFLAWAKGS